MIKKNYKFLRRIKLSKSFLDNAVDIYKEQKQNWFMETCLILHGQNEEIYATFENRIMPLQQTLSEFQIFLKTLYEKENIINENLLKFKEKKLCLKMENPENEPSKVIQKNRAIIEANNFMLYIFEKSLHKVYKVRVKMNIFSTYTAGLQKRPPFDDFSSPNLSYFLL
jgi:hypothetical protein